MAGVDWDRPGAHRVRSVDGWNRHWEWPAAAVGGVLGRRLALAMACPDPTTAYHDLDDLEHGRIPDLMRDL